MKTSTFLLFYLFAALCISCSSNSNTSQKQIDTVPQKGADTGMLSGAGVSHTGAGGQDGSEQPVERDSREKGADGLPDSLVAQSIGRTRDMAQQLAARCKKVDISPDQLKQGVIRFLDTLIAMGGDTWPDSWESALERYCAQISRVPVFTNVLDTNEVSDPLRFGFLNPAILRDLPGMCGNTEIAVRFQILNRYVGNGRISEYLTTLNDAYVRLQEKGSIEDTLCRYLGNLMYPSPDGIIPPPDCDIFWFRRYLDNTIETVHEIVSIIASQPSMYVSKVRAEDVNLYFFRSDSNGGVPYTSQDGELLPFAQAYEYHDKKTAGSDSVHMCIAFVDEYPRTEGQQFLIEGISDDINVRDVSQAGNTYISEEYEGPHYVLDHPPVFSQWKSVSSTGGVYTIGRIEEASFKDFPAAPEKAKYEGGNLYTAVEEIFLRIGYLKGKNEKKIIVMIPTPSGD
jgi:hypothetical protein